MAAADVSTRGRFPARRVGRWLVIVTLAGGVLLWAQLRPVECVVAFDVPPAMRADSGPGVERADLRGVDARFYDAEGAQAAWSRIDLPRGLEGPVTPPIVVRLPRGTYSTEVVLSVADGRTVTRRLPVELSEEGYLRVDLDVPR